MYIEYAVAGAPWVPHKEPCMGKAGVTVEHSLIYLMYRASCGFGKQGCKEAGSWEFVVLWADDL